MIISSYLNNSFEPILFDKRNNFDLIRLFAALQVVLGHSGNHLNLTLPSFLSIFSYFPGVPIFFGISGFLITNAYFRNPNIKTFIKNRSLRIFPGLWICFLVTILLLLYFKVIPLHFFISSDFFYWFFSQTTFFQFYTPNSLRNWGVGTPNGSLWTIAVELQFYFFLPLFLMMTKKIKKNAFLFLLCLIFLISISIGNIYASLNDNSIFSKLLHVSLPLYLHFFLLGIISFLYWENLKLFFKNKFFIWLFVYLVYVFIFCLKLKLYSLSYYPNIFGFVSNILLWFTVLSAAFSYKNISEKVLKGNDISYGVYIYHMLVINTMLSLNINNYSSILKLFIVFLATILLATISWKFVEYPILKRKK